MKRSLEPTPEEFSSDFIVPSVEKKKKSDHCFLYPSLLTSSTWLPLSLSTFAFSLARLFAPALIPSRFRYEFPVLLSKEKSTSPSYSEPKGWVVLGHLRWICIGSKANELILYKGSRSYQTITQKLHPDDEKDNRRVVYICGGPGTGKTVSCWNYLLEYLQMSEDMNISKEVVWVSIPNGIIIHLKSDGIAICESMNDFTILNLLKSRYTGINLIVIDGIQSIHLTSTTCWCTVLKEITINLSFPNLEKSIIVTSLQSIFGIKEIKAWIGSSIFIPSWTAADYLPLCANDAVFDRIRGNCGDVVGKQLSNDEKVRVLMDKYSIAGSNAHWFFDLTVEGVIKVINDSLRLVTNKKALLEGKMGNDSDFAMNALLCRVSESSRPTVTSHYVIRKLSQDITQELLQSMISFAQTMEGQRNPALNGWISELAVLSSITRGSFADKVFSCDADQNSVFHVSSIHYPFPNQPNQFIESLTEENIFKFLISVYIRKSTDTQDSILKLLSLENQDSLEANLLASGVKTDALDDEVSFPATLWRLIAANHYDMYEILSRVDFKEKMDALNGVWFIPVVFNQGGYDCCQLVIEHESLILKFMQIPRDLRFELKVGYMTTFLQKFNNIIPKALGFSNVKKMEIAFIVPFDLVKAVPPMKSWDIITKRPKSEEEGLGISYRLYSFEF
jgi:hypothetical protein